MELLTTCKPNITAILFWCNLQNKQAATSNSDSERPVHSYIVTQWHQTNHHVTLDSVSMFICSGKKSRRQRKELQK